MSCVPSVTALIASIMMTHITVAPGSRICPGTDGHVIARNAWSAYVERDAGIFCPGDRAGPADLLFSGVADVSAGAPAHSGGDEIASGPIQRLFHRRIIRGSIGDGGLCRDGKAPACARYRADPGLRLLW